MNRPKPHRTRLGQPTGFAPDLLFADAMNPTASDATINSDAKDVALVDDNARAYAWSLLGALLTRPLSAEILQTLKALPDTRDSNNQMALSWLALKMAGANISDAEAVLPEYNDLFIGVGRGELVPYGSWYMTGFLMDRPLAELRADLKRLGFERNVDVKEPEDHAGALAETMAMLIADQSIPAKAQNTFFERHMDPWMQRFFQDLAGAKKANFYRAVGQFGAQFVETEREYLSL